VDVAFGDASSDALGAHPLPPRPSSPAVEGLPAERREEMKTVGQIIKQRSVYFHNWVESKRFGVLSDFFDCGILTEKEFHDPAYPGDNTYRRECVEKMKGVLEDMKAVKILFASYTYENYSGSAFVLFAKDGKLYEVNGSHCSCYGLEGQWVPEETVLKELVNRIVNGTFGREYSENTFADGLALFLGVKLKESPHA
jgi:hypothetical protein